MCGIFGIVSNSPIEQQAVEQCTYALRHRGPDAQGIYMHQSGKVALGHRRLSILDLSERANQPMTSADGKYVIVFNGEIFNFRQIIASLYKHNPQLSLKTTSDTEVILLAFQQWGPDMVNHLEGMFAIALLEQSTQNLWLFRDRLGKKPIYYYWEKDVFVFGSELKSLLVYPKVSVNLELDLQSVHRFLHLGFIPEDASIYRSIRKFPSGCVGTLENLNYFSIKRYWKPDASHALNQAPDQDYKAAFTSLLENSVSNRLISDVPVGCFLSGGTDSSLIAAFASRLSNTKLKTFSIGFRESKFNEQKYAERVADVLKTDHVSYVLAEEEAADLVETYLGHIGEPFADTSMIPTMLVSKLARNEVTVALTGDGGDELFLGYGSYNWAKRLANPVTKLLSPIGARVLHLTGSSQYRRVSHLLERVPKEQRAGHIFSQEQYFFSDKELVNKLLMNTLPYQPYIFKAPKEDWGLSSEEQQAFFDISCYLKDDLLVKVDRASMYYALECRSPLLDYRIVEFALKAPFNVKRRSGIDKWLLKNILGDYLPKELVHRKKWGFSIPLSKWLKGKFKYLVDENLSQEVVSDFKLVKYTYVKELLMLFDKGDEYLFNRIWVLIVLHKWLRENRHNGFARN
jgi:asparagine synthase (glutamine-hydrolysing)